MRPAGAAAQPRLRVLALAGEIDMGGNTPIEFLLEGSDIELKTLYIVPGCDLPVPLASGGSVYTGERGCIPEGKAAIST